MKKLFLAIFTLTYVMAFSQITPGVYYIQSKIGDKYMDVQWGNSANGTILHLWDENPNPAQEFNIQPSGEAGYYFIRSAYGNKTLDASGNQAGATLRIWDYHGRDNQKFRFVDVGGGYYKIQSKLGTFIDVKGANATSGTQIWMFVDWKSPDAQSFRLKKKTEKITIPRATWQSMLNGVFSRTCVRLNNYTPVQNQYDRNEREFFRPNDSYIQLNFNGNNIRYPIPIDVLQTGPDRMFKMYVNDWNSSSITASAENGRIRVSIRMEDDGTEIVGKCYNNFNCGFTSPPTFNYSNSVLDIFLDLVPQSGRVSYDAQTSFNANVGESGPCVNNFFAFLCPSDRAGLIKSNVEATVNAHLNSEVVKSLLIQTIANIIPAGTVVNRVAINSQGDIVIN